MSLEKFITPEGAQALREFAAAMPLAIENITSSVEKLNNTFTSVAEGLGTDAHQQDFQEVLNCVKKAQEKAAEAIEVLPKRLEENAAVIDEIVRKRYGINHSGN